MKSMKRLEDDTGYTNLKTIDKYGMNMLIARWESHALMLLGMLEILRVGAAYGVMHIEL